MVEIKKLRISITLLLIILMLSSITVYAQKKTGFVVVNKTGAWESDDPLDIRSKSMKGYAYIEFEYSNAILGSWQSNIEIILTGEAGDRIVGAYIIEIPELRFKIEYYKILCPGMFMNIGEKISNELKIVVGDKVMYDKNQTASWPYTTRLNTRIYYSIWRSSNNTLTIVVQDYYGSIFKNLSIFWSMNLTYTGKPLTLKIKLWKNSGKPSQISSYIYFNDVVENKIYKEMLGIKKLNIGTSVMFYTSLGFLIIALIANIFSKNLTRGEKTEEMEKSVKKKKRKKK